MDQSQIPVKDGDVIIKKYYNEYTYCAFNPQQRDLAEYDGIYRITLLFL